MDLAREGTLERAKVRQASGKPIGKLQLIAHCLADIAAQIGSLS